METDFFDLHRAQCGAYVTAASSVVGASAFVAALQNAIALCDAAIANGSLQADVPVVAATIPQIEVAYQALDGATRTAIDDAIRAALTVAP